MEKIGRVIGKAIVIIVATFLLLLIIGIALILLGFVGLGIESVWKSIM